MIVSIYDGMRRMSGRNFFFSEEKLTIQKSETDAAVYVICASFLGCRTTCAAWNYIRLSPRMCSLRTCMWWSFFRRYLRPEHCFHLRRRRCRTSDKKNNSKKRRSREITSARLLYHNMSPLNLDGISIRQRFENFAWLVTLRNLRKRRLKQHAAIFRTNHEEKQQTIQRKHNNNK